MNIEVLEVFDEVKNVEFSKIAYCEEFSTELLVFTLKEETVEEWNAKAREINTKTFIEVFGNSPRNYDEVLAWMYSILGERGYGKDEKNETSYRPEASCL